MKQPAHSGVQLVSVNQQTKEQAKISEIKGALTVLYDVPAEDLHLVADLRNLMTQEDEQLIEVVDQLVEKYVYNSTEPEHT